MKQLDVFNLLHARFMFPKNHTIRLVELFSGIGFQSMGMDLAEIKHEQVATSEIDKFAIQSYEAIHGISNNMGDISQLTGSNFPKDIDIMTYSFPCQDLSKAGKQKGMGEGSRSGLVYEVLRILEELQEANNLPKVLIMENVTDLVGAKFIKEFNEIQYEIESFGYINYVENLNSKNYGIAQNRDRTFMVSILGEYSYNFPQPFPLKYRLKDYLEDEVDEKYYLSDKAFKGIKNTTFNSSTLNARTEKDGIIPTLFARDYKDPKLVVETTKAERIGGIFDKEGKRHQAGSVWNKENVAPTIDTMQGGYRQPLVIDDMYANREPRLYGEVAPTLRSERTGLKVVEDYIPIPEATTKGYKEAYVGDGVYINRPHQKRGTVQDGMIQTLKANSSDVGVVVKNEYLGISVHPNSKKMEFKGFQDKEAPALLATDYKAPKTVAYQSGDNLRIRKLTPRETGRLMGMNDEQIDKQLATVSNSQAYKQHGNGIVAQVIGLIIGMMYYEDEEELRNIVMKNSHTWIERKI